MNRIFFILVFITLGLSSLYAQDSFETFTGDVIKKGDVLKIGSLSSIYSPYLFIREKANKEGKDEYLNIKENLAFSDVVVREIIQPENSMLFGSDNTIILAYNTALDKEYVIGIDNAIARGEIIDSYVDHTYDNAVFLSDDLLLACCIRVNGLAVDDRMVLLFIKINDKDLYDKCKKDEFEFQAVKGKYKQLLQTMVENFDFSSTYYIKNKLEIGKYDFGKNAYPLTYIHDEKRNFHRYGDYEFIITNPEFGKFVPVSHEEAQKCNKRRMGLGRNGYISSLAYARIYFKILDKKMELVKDKFQIINLENLYRHRVVGVQLTRMEVYDYEHCDYNLIGSIE